MKKLLFFMCLIPSTLFAGLSQTNQSYRDETAIRREFNNIYLNAQGKQFVVFKSTPNLNDLQDGQMVLVSSTNRGIAWRDGNTVNFMTSSGVLYTNNYITFTSNTYISNGVSRIVAGSNVTISPSGGTGEVTINSTGGGGGGVTQIVAGSNITISPVTGLGAVTINSSGGSSVDLWELDGYGGIQPIAGSGTSSFWEEDGTGGIQPL